MRTPKRAIVLRLDANTVNRIDNVRHTMRMDRSTWLRRAVAKHLAHNLEHELPLLERREIQAALMP
jgi:predicted transcriptional regulator